MNITFKVIFENPDGSADLEVDYDEEGSTVLAQYGVIAILKEAIANNTNFSASFDTHKNTQEYPQINALRHEGMSALMHEGMNAYELATEMDDSEPTYTYMGLASNMLRQQADRIAELENVRCSACGWNPKLIEPKEEK